jgi:hypothetical protein
MTQNKHTKQAKRMHNNVTSNKEEGSSHSERSSSIITLQGACHRSDHSARSAHERDGWTG